MPQAGAIRIAKVARQQAQIAELRGHFGRAAGDAFIPRLAIDHRLRRLMTIQAQGPLDGVLTGQFQVPLPPGGIHHVVYQRRVVVLFCGPDLALAVHGGPRMLRHQGPRRGALDGRIELLVQGIVGLIHAGGKADIVCGVARPDHLHQAVRVGNTTLPDQIRQAVDEEVQALVIGVVEHTIEFLHKAHVPAVVLPRCVAGRIDLVRTGKIGLQHGKVLRPAIRHRFLEAGLGQPDGGTPEGVAEP